VTARASVRKLASVIAAAAMPLPGFAAPALIADVVVSSAAAPSTLAPITFRLDSRPGAGPKGRHSVGVKAGLGEGKPLEMAVWGGAGAIAGSLAGPAGAVIGAGAGALCGLLYSVFIVPRNGPNSLQ